MRIARVNLAYTSGRTAAPPRWNWTFDQIRHYGWKWWIEDISDTGLSPLERLQELGFTAIMLGNATGVWDDNLDNEDQNAMGTFDPRAWPYIPDSILNLSDAMRKMGMPFFIWIGVATVPRAYNRIFEGVPIEEAFRDLIRPIRNSLEAGATPALDKPGHNNTDPAWNLLMRRISHMCRQHNHIPLAERLNDITIDTQVLDGFRGVYVVSPTKDGPKPYICDVFDRLGESPIYMLHDAENRGWLAHDGLLGDLDTVETIDMRQLIRNGTAGRPRPDPEPGAIDPSPTERDG